MNPSDSKPQPDGCGECNYWYSVEEHWGECQHRNVNPRVVCYPNQKGKPLFRSDFCCTRYRKWEVPSE